MRGPFDREWRRCICVASGPSLSAEQVDLVKAAQRYGWRVFVANSTWEKLPDADVLFGADRPFWNAFHHEIAAGFHGECWTGESGASKEYGLQYIEAKSEIDQRTGIKGGLSRDPRYMRHGGNSGAHTVALAYAMGAEVIVLVGFDMQHTGGTVNRDGILIGGPIHHHGPHVRDRLANPQPAALAGWAERMAVTARDLADAGVTVINCTAETALRCFPRANLAETLEKYGRNMDIETIYNRHCSTPTAITPHLPRLRAVAEGLDLAVEFGVKRGASSSALLMGAKKVISFDVVETREARELEAVAGDRWDYRLEDSRTAEVPPADMLFIDSQHDYEQCKAELDAHGHNIRKYIVLHDTATFGVVGADGESGRHKWAYVPGKGSVPLDCLGVRFAVDDYQIAHPEWRIAAHYADSHGLLVLRREV